MATQKKSQVGVAWIFEMIQNLWQSRPRRNIASAEEDWQRFEAVAGGDYAITLDGYSAPDGFADAIAGRDANAMRLVSEKYKANRAKKDVMNTKHVKRGISEEQIYRESL